MLCLSGFELYSSWVPLLNAKRLIDLKLNASPLLLIIIILHALVL